MSTSVESNNLSFVNDLNPAKDMWHMKARIIRKWNQGYKMDHIFIDENGVKIQGDTKSHLIPVFDGQLQEDAVVILSKFGVSENKDLYKVVAHDYKINFYRCTAVTPVRDWQDVVGSMVWCRDLEFFGQPPKETKRVNFDIQDLEGTVLRCTMWNDYALQFNDLISKTPVHEHVMAVIQHGKCKEWKVVSTHVSQTLSTTQIITISTPAQKQKTPTDISIVVTKTEVETPGVPTVVSHPSTTALNISTSQPKSPSPKKLYKRKRKFQKNADDIPAPIPLSSTPYNVINPQPPTQISSTRIESVAEKYPLELEAVKDEMKQFYTIDDPWERRFPSLIGFRNPLNMSEYLKLKARQADIRARIECKDQGDKAISERMEFLLTKVKQMEDYAKDMSKDMSNIPPDAALQKGNDKGVS
ncbi:uncharacterized protein LOC118483969 [Helianthus annuus]|uniref:uncharacterized protein LOC118483969 n=1 Tax=Helianthus annuus TaxID=4232 RepID=UPI001652C790|nr:uncharacterized protein LOC118483969 [Helianthus annuus]